MSDIATQYRHREFRTPTVAPFDKAGTLLWPTLVGTFLRPVIESAPDMSYWFCNHGTDFQFCFAHNDISKTDKLLDEQLKKYATTEIADRSKTQTIGTAFLGERWIAKSKINCDMPAARRSKLIFYFLHATSALFLDSIVQVGDYWGVERLVDAAENPKSENPLGNGFESLLHLVSNISQAQFELLNGNRTGWMPPQPAGNTRLQL